MFYAPILFSTILVSVGGISFPFCPLNSTQPATTRATATLILGWNENGTSQESNWEFRARPDQPGLQVRAEGRGVRVEFDLVNGLGTGPVVDLTARAYFAGTAWHMVVLGVGSLTATYDMIEYRLVVYHSLDSMPSKEHWMHTRPLLVRPVCTPVDGMSVSFPGGDSVLFGLHELTRGGDGSDAIESHFFVNHCPVGGREGRIPDGTTEYYKATVQGGGQTIDRIGTHRGLKASDDVSPE